MAYLSVIFVNVMWGLSFIASKVALESGFSPFTLALFRYLITCVLLLPFLGLKAGGLKMPRQGLGALVISSLTGVTLYFLFEYEGLERTSPSSAALIVAAIPAFSLLWQSLRRKKRSHPACYAGVAASLVGVVLVVGLGGEGDSWQGNLLMLGACFCWVIYLETSASLQTKWGYDSTSLTAWQSLIGLVTLVPCALIEQALTPEAGRFHWTAVAPAGWVSVMFLAAVCSALCYVLYNRSIRALSPFRTSLFLNLNPVTAMAADALMRGARPSPAQLLGGAVILVSIFVVSRASGREAVREAV